MGVYKSGHKKEGGRKKGTRNKNIQIKDNIRDFVLENYDDFCKTYKTLSPKEKCHLYIKLMDFVIPKISAVRFEDSKDADSAIELLRMAAQYGDEK